MYSVDVDHPARDVGEQLGRIEPAEGFLRDQRRLPDHGRRVLHLLEPLGRGRPEPHRGERRLDWVRRPEVLDSEPKVTPPHSFTRLPTLPPSRSFRELGRW